MSDKKFKMVIPATIEKSEDGEWRIMGLASTASRDLQGENINLKGLDLTPIKKGKGVWSYDHKKGPENTLGIIDTYNLEKKGLYLGGYLFKNHDRAKAVHQIMSSLNKSDRGRVGMSVEGVVKQRAGRDGKTINKAVISGCALTLNPINTDTYCDLVKSFSSVDFDRTNIECDFSHNSEENTISFSTKQVLELLQRAMQVGSEYAESKPSDLTGGTVLSQEDLYRKKKRKKSKKLKKADAEFYKSAFYEIIQYLKTLYPSASVTEIFETVKDRLNTRFPDIKL